jgi:hypothetical protein
MHLDMHEPPEYYISNLKFKCPVRYAHDDSGIMMTRRDEITLYPNVFQDCPSVDTLVNAIEKKASKSEPIRGNSNVVPLCMAILCSKGYSINSSCFENIDDVLIERCWENLKVISHSIDIPLQKWIETTMGTRSATSYSLKFCDSYSHPSRQYENEVVHMNISIPRGIRLMDCSSFGNQLPISMYSKDDVVANTVLLHMRIFSSNISDDAK